MDQEQLRLKMLMEEEEERAASSGAGGGSGKDMSGPEGGSEAPARSEYSIPESFAAGVSNNLPFSRKISPYERLQSDEQSGVLAAHKQLEEIDSLPAGDKMATGARLGAGFAGPWGGDTGRQRPEMPMSYEDRSKLGSNPVSYVAGAVVGKLPEMAAQSKALSPLGAAKIDPPFERAIHSAKGAVSKTEVSKLDEMVVRGAGFDDALINKMSANQRYFDAIDEISGDIGHLPPGDSARVAQGVLGVSAPFPDVPSLSEIASSVRSNASFPYSVGSIGRKIDEPASVLGRQGSTANPNIGPIGQATAVETLPSVNRARFTPQPGSPKEINLGPPDDLDADLMWRGASTDELSSIARPGPAAFAGPNISQAGMQKPIQTTREYPIDIMSQQPPLAPADRMVRDQTISSAKSGSDEILSGGGLQQTTVPGALRNIFMRKLPMAIGMQKDKIAKMQSILSGAMDRSAEMMSGTHNKAMLGRLIDSLANSKDSDEAAMMDNMYKEMYPEYNSLSLAAEKDNINESK